MILNTNSLPDGDGTDAARFPSTVLFNKFQIWNAPFQFFRSLVNILREGIPLQMIMFSLGGGGAQRPRELAQNSNVNCTHEKLKDFLSTQLRLLLQNEQYNVDDLKGLTAPYNRVHLDRGGIISMPLIIPGRFG